MKSLVMAFFLMSVSIGNLFTAAVNFFIQNDDGTSKLAGADYYLFFSAAMLVTAVLGLRYETTPDQIRHLLANIRRMLHAHPKIDRNTVRVRYAGPGSSSRDVNIRIYVLTHDWNEFHAVREDVFLRIDDLVQESGVGYAFPSQTLYLTRDQMPDAERGAAAEAEVAAWRAANEMPYPRLSEKIMDELEGTLD